MCRSGCRARRIHLRSQAARDDSLVAVRPADGQRVVGHDAAPGNPGPSDALGSHDGEQDVERSRLGLVGDGDAEGHLLRGLVLRVANGRRLVAVLAGRGNAKLFVDIRGGSGLDGVERSQDGRRDLEKTHLSFDAGEYLGRDVDRG